MNTAEKFKYFVRRTMSKNYAKHAHYLDISYNVTGQVYFRVSVLSSPHKWVKVFKNGPSKICVRESLK